MQFSKLRGPGERLWAPPAASSSHQNEARTLAPLASTDTMSYDVWEAGLQNVLNDAFCFVLSSEEWIKLFDKSTSLMFVRKPSMKANRPISVIRLLPSVKFLKHLMKSEDFLTLPIRTSRAISSTQRYRIKGKGHVILVSGYLILTAVNWR